MLPLRGSSVSEVNLQQTKAFIIWIIALSGLDYSFQLQTCIHSSACHLFWYLLGVKKAWTMPVPPRGWKKNPNECSEPINVTCTVIYAISPLPGEVWVVFSSASIPVSITILPSPPFQLPSEPQPKHEQHFPHFFVTMTSAFPKPFVLDLESGCHHVYHSEIQIPDQAEFQVRATLWEFSETGPATPFGIACLWRRHGMLCVPSWTKIILTTFKVLICIGQQRLLNCTVYTRKWLKWKKSHISATRLSQNYLTLYHLTSL